MKDNGIDIYKHGGNIYGFIRKRKLRIENVIDFSASINPLGVPERVVKTLKENIKLLCHYPDPDGTLLRDEIARHLREAQTDIDASSIICGNGSTELIYLIVRALRPELVLIPIPTFSEYERAALVNKASGLKTQIRYLPLKGEDNFDIDVERFITSFETAPCRMAFLCNPNNPTGRVTPKKEVLKIAETAKRHKCYLVVDEAFIDFVPDESVIGEVKNNPYLIVLRSMTKFYALSGLRIGYGVLPERIIEKLKKYKEPWTVNSLAQAAGIAALNDSKYKEKTYKIIEKEKRLLENGFASLGITYIPSQANFYLLRHKKAQRIISGLEDAGIMVRDCSNFRGLNGTYMRIAVRTNRENKRLLEELKKICQDL